MFDSDVISDDDDNSEQMKCNLCKQISLIMKKTISVNIFFSKLYTTQMFITEFLNK